MTKNFYPDSVEYYGQQLTQKISLKEKFKVERKAMRVLPGDAPEQHYLTADLQKEYHVECSDKNLFHNISADLMDGQFNFALLCEEEPNLICDKLLHHSSLANGKKVFAIGSLTFTQGKLIEITNNSGHYTPTDEEMLAVIKALYWASGGTLQRYVSYCSQEPKVYSVVDLLNVNDFSSVTPLEIEKNNNSSIPQSEENPVDSTNKSQYLDEDIIVMDNQSLLSTSGQYEEKLDSTKAKSEFLDGIVVTDNQPLLSTVAATPTTILNSTIDISTLNLQRRYGKNLKEDVLAKYQNIVGKNNFFKQEIYLKEDEDSSAVSTCSNK